ncbi:hypothetical protein A6A06_16190 [Streptomyces sp. CB02923]|uniref:hypothetical protein n=1 Tax=Streptomyces sp. CB02923 TaxID=1718985 RepID=UPI00093C7649|nr:hypothetical protein [Streptomyces sp. CB02923]OKI02554.1 hypothetical protein A6A06_16190 [Streptomyces sp. CB02923]
MPETRTDGTDLTWLLTHGAGMAWQYAMAVQTSLTDMQAAYEDGNHPACVESCAVALRAIVYCRQVGDGYVRPPGHLEHHLHLAVEESPAARALRDLPAPPTATRETAEAAMAVVHEHDEQLRNAIPLTIPVIRTAKGYFPTVRIAASLEELRATHGLGPVDWDQWGI